MKLSKIDLSNVLAIAHNDDYLGLVLNRGETLDVVEVPAPLAAYEGLQLLNAIANSDSSTAVDADFYELPGVEPEISMLPVQSTMANSVGYDGDRRVLQVEFKNGAVYQYENVDAATWQQFRVAGSAGKFFNREIKGQYDSHRIDP